MRTGSLFFFSLLSIVCCIILGIIASWNVLIFFDIRVESYIASFRSETLTEIMKWCSLFGGVYGTVFIAGVVSVFLILRKHSMFAGVYGLAVILGGVINVLLKTYLKIERPSLQLVDIFGWSYPSGHVTMAVITLIFATFFLLRTTLHTFWVRVVIVVCAVALVGGVVMSRIYLGAHFASDVVGGIYLGASIVFLGTGVVMFLSRRSSYRVNN